MAEITSEKALLSLKRDSKLGRAAYKWGKNLVLVAYERSMPVETFHIVAKQSCQEIFGQ